MILPPCLIPLSTKISPQQWLRMPASDFYLCRAHFIDDICPEFATSDLIRRFFRYNLFVIADQEILKTTKNRKDRNAHYLNGKHDHTFRYERVFMVFMSQKECGLFHDMNEFVHNNDQWSRTTTAMRTMKIMTVCNMNKGRPPSQTDKVFGLITAQDLCTLLFWIANRNSQNA